MVPFVAWFENALPEWTWLFGVACPIPWRYHFLDIRLPCPSRYQQQDVSGSSRWYVLSFADARRNRVHYLRPTIHAWNTAKMVLTSLGCPWLVRISCSDFAIYRYRWSLLLNGNTDLRTGTSKFGTSLAHLDSRFVMHWVLRIETVALNMKPRWLHTGGAGLSWLDHLSSGTNRFQSTPSRLEEHGIHEFCSNFDTFSSILFIERQMEQGSILRFLNQMCTRQTDILIVILAISNSCVISLYSTPYLSSMLKEISVLSVAISTFLALLSLSWYSCAER